MAPISSATAPIATTGVPGVVAAPAPTAGAQAAPITNQSTATSFGAPVAAPAAAPANAYQSYAAPVAGQQATPGAQSTADIVNSFAGNTASSVTGGGAGDPISQLASFAQNKMTEIQNKVSALFKSDGGQPDMAAVQFLNTQMTTMTWVSEQAAKMEEKRERAMQVWVR